MCLQLFISPDTTKLDGSLVGPALQELDVPELAQSILIFKRGYGSSYTVSQFFSHP